MKAHAKCGNNNASFKTTNLNDTLSAQQFELFTIAVKMKKSGLSDSFIVAAVETALRLEGVSDLMHLWLEEDNSKEKDEIIADIQEMIDASSQNEKTEEIYVKFNDLDAIAKNIRGFKDSLYQAVIEYGGVTKLSEATGIPQPSLSRFFNSSSIPRRATLLRIAKILGTDKVKMDILWSK